MDAEYEVIDSRGNRIMATDTLRVKLPKWHKEASVLNGRLVRPKTFYTGRTERDSGTLFVKSHDEVWNEVMNGLAIPGSWLRIVN